MTTAGVWFAISDRRGVSGAQSPQSGPDGGFAQRERYGERIQLDVEAWWDVGASIQWPPELQRRYVRAELRPRISLHNPTLDVLQMPEDQICRCTENPRVKKHSIEDFALMILSVDTNFCP